MSAYIYTANSNGKVVGISHKYAKSEASRSLQMSDNAVSLSAFGPLAAAAKANIQSVSLGSNVLSVLDDSFNGCTGLLTVTYKTLFKHVGARAFKGCISLQSLSLPESTQFIGADAFSGCSSIVAISLPKHELTAKDNAFQGLKKITSLSASFSSESGKALFKNATSLKSLVVSGTMTESIFEGCTSLAEATISAEQVPYRSFYGCTKLTKVIFKKTVDMIGPEAFAKCTALSSIDLSSTTIDAVHRDFINGTAITSIVLPETITSLSQIDANAFRGSKLTNVQLLGFTDKYISENMSKFGRFGADQNITYVSKDGVESSLKPDGDGLKSTSLYVISIGVDHTERGVNTLKGIHKDVETLYKMVSKVYADNMSQVIFRKIGEGDSSLEPATKENIDQCFDDALSKNPELLIFHFSDHGDYKDSDDYVEGSTTKYQMGYIMLTDYNMSYQSLFTQFRKFNRVLAIFCCCFPWYGVASPSRDKAGHTSLNGDQTTKEYYNDSKILVWCGGGKNEVTTMDPNVGHFFMQALSKTFDSSSTYAKTWKNAQSSNKWTYDVKSESYTGSVTPTKYNYSDFTETKQVFT